MTHTTTTSAATTSALLFRRSVRKARRSPALAFAFPILFPVFIIGLFSQVYGKVNHIPGFPHASYVDWMAPAVLLMAAMFGAQYSAQGLLADAESGYLDRLRLLPAHPAGFMLGRLAFDVVRVLIAAACVMLVSVALGAHWQSLALAAPALVVLLALWTLAYGGLYYLVGLRTRKQEAMMGLIPLFLPLSMLSTAYLPRPLLPGWIQWVSRANPYSYLVDAVRMFTTGTPRWSTFGAAVLAGALAVALVQLGAARAFGRLVEQD